MKRWPTAWAGLAVALVLAVGAWGTAAGGEAPPESGELEAAGKRGALLFRIHCATCHGREARGDGPLASDLLTRPADLTRVTAPDEGEFPSERLRAAIDGRDQIRGHGSREMPVWGLAFQDGGRADSQEEAVSERIDDLLAFLETIQVTEGAPD